MNVPQYVLSLDELPVVVEADGRVHPVFMTLRDGARLFDVPDSTFSSWLKLAGIKSIKVGHEKLVYIEVAHVVAWIRKNHVSLAHD